MTCPVCLGAFSWKEDLLHHFGAVHHLEELVAHLESEFTCETCPPCCRVPQTLFKSLLPEQASRMPSSVRVSDTAPCMQGNLLTATECSNTTSPVHKLHLNDGTYASGNGGIKKSESCSSPRRRLSDICIESIERYHCDLCEFSANDIHQLVEHGSEHNCQELPVPPAAVGLSETASKETDEDCSPRKQVQEWQFCDMCPFSTKYPHCLRQHMTAHKRSALVEVGYKCAYCNFARINRCAVRNHQNSCHRKQPLKILYISGGKVVKGSSNFEVKSYDSDAKKQRKLKLSKSKFVALKRNSSLFSKSQMAVMNRKSGSASSLSKDEVLSSDQAGSAETLISKLPEQMIYPEPVCCPLCEFNSRVRVNLVRHIRSTHGFHQQSQTASPSTVSFTNRVNVDPSQVQMSRFHVSFFVALC